MNHISLKKKAKILCKGLGVMVLQSLWYTHPCLSYLVVSSLYLVVSSLDLVVSSLDLVVSSLDL